MKILVLCGDYWHPPQIAREGLTALTEAAVEFDFIDDARAWSPEVMLRYRLVILTKSNNVSPADRTAWMTPAVEAAFAEHVQRGSGLLAIHSGTSEYDQAPVLRGLLGGIFANHPPQCPVIVTPRARHPLCERISPFTVQDEHYFMTLNAPDAEVFLTTVSEHGEQPGGWRRQVGHGRVAVLTPGHNAEVWQHSSFQALLRNCLRWCGKLI